MPFAVRGNKNDCNNPRYNGDPVFIDGQWYSLWSMRPSRVVFSAAIGLESLEGKYATQPIICEKGRTLINTWTVHHVYECGLKELTIKQRAERFTNLSNLVLMSKKFHETEKEYVHGSDYGAQWLRWIICKLYPKPSRSLERITQKNNFFPVDFNIAIDNQLLSLAKLKELRERTPAGNIKATKKLEIQRARS